MGRTLSTAVRASATVWSDVVGNRDLRRLEIGRTWSVMAEAIATVGFGVYAFQRSGPLAIAGLVAVQMLPGALAAPWLSGAADHFRRERVLRVAELTRGIAMAVTAILVHGHAPVAVVALMAAVLSVASATFYPARRSLVPLLVRTPRELTSANVASSTLQSAGLMLGPIVSGAVLSIDGTIVWPVFVIASVAFLGSALGLLRIRSTSSVWLPVRSDGESARRTALRVVRADRHLQAVLAAFTVKNLARGAFTVFVVTIPLSLLKLNTPAVGFLSAAVGAGGLTAGLLGGAALLHGRRLARLMVGGLLLWSLPMFMIAATPTALAALVGLAAVGLGNSVVDVSGYTLITRNAADDVLARVFGLHETTRAVGIALGAFVTAVGVDDVGTRTTLVAAGAVVTAAALALWAPLASVDRASRVPTERLALLRASRLFGRLQPLALERLAKRMQPVSVARGDAIVREGEVGQAVYLVSEGTLDVVSAGQTVAALHHGDHFGEIALLQASPRTASVVAETPATVFMLDGEDFMSAVSGHPVSSSIARSTADERLRELAGLAGGDGPTPAPAGTAD
jgi:predicted MFS family arabinose efflux permease